MEKNMSGRSLFVILGVLGASATHLGKRIKKGTKKLIDIFPFWRLFSAMWLKKWASKNECFFFGRSFFHQNGPRASQKEYSGGSGSQKGPKMEPKIDTFGDLWNLVFCCYLLGLDHF